MLILKKMKFLFLIKKLKMYFWKFENMHVQS